MNIVRENRQAILFLKSLGLDIYELSNGELRVGVERVSRVLGYRKHWVMRILYRQDNVPKTLRLIGFTRDIQKIVVPSTRGDKEVKTISLEDFSRLVQYAVSRDKKAALDLQLNLDRFILETYDTHSVKKDKKTDPKSRRDLLDEEYETIHQQIMEHMKTDGLGDLETEDDILSVAVALTL